MSASPKLKAELARQEQMVAELEDEMERLETEALEREERLLREEMLHRLRREENRLREQLDLERDRRIEAHAAKLRDRLKDEMETEYQRRRAFLEGYRHLCQAETTVGKVRQDHNHQIMVHAGGYT